MKKGKKYQIAKSKIDTTKRHELKEALSLAKEISYVKFDESVDMAVKLGINARKSDQMIRGSVVLPHGTGKSVKILVFAKGEKEKEALAAGADYAGSDELIEKIKDGWLDFDRTIATPDMMGNVGKLGKVLGPRGLMPNPKTGTVTFDVGKVIEEIKKGKIDFRVEKAGIVHVPIGRVSFSVDQLLDNAYTLLNTILKLKPPTSKGEYFKSLAVSTTMGPGFKLDVFKLKNELK